MWQAAPQRLHVPLPVLDAKASASIDRSIRKSFVDAPSDKDVSRPNIIDEQNVPIESGIDTRFLNHKERSCESIRRLSLGVTIEVGFIEIVDPLWVPDPVGWGIRCGGERMGCREPIGAPKVIPVQERTEFPDGRFKSGIARKTEIAKRNLVDRVQPISTPSDDLARQFVRSIEHGLRLDS